jgi:predicted AAA+ superfamily ATPase
LATEAQIDGPETSPRTTRKYLDQLTQIYVLDELPAWSVHLRSSIALRAKPKWHFVDPSLGVAALRASPASLLEDLETLGTFFEAMVVRDLRTYADTIDARVFHYRHSGSLEVDVITAGTASYLRDDGIQVIALGHLTA